MAVLKITIPEDSNQLDLLHQNLRGHTVICNDARPFEFSVNIDGENPIEILREKFGNLGIPGLKMTVQKTVNITDK